MKTTNRIHLTVEAEAGSVITRSWCSVYAKLLKDAFIAKGWKKVRVKAKPAGRP